MGRVHAEQERRAPAGRAPATQGAPATAPGKHAGLIGVQARAGNRATNALLAGDQTIRRKATKQPTAAKGSEQEKLTAELADLAEASNQPEMARVSKELWDLDDKYYLNLLLAIANKHRDNDTYRRLYSSNMPAQAYWPSYELAWRTKDEEGVAFCAKTGWDADEAATKRLALQDPAFFIDHFLIDGLRRKDADRQLLQSIVEEKTFLADLQTSAPKAFERLVKAVPVLKLVKGVEAEMAKQALDGVDDSGQLVNIDVVVGKLFDAFVQNKGMEVAYSGSKIDESAVFLSGRTKASDKERAAKKKIMKDMPKKLSTACHQLLALFTSVLKSYPGIESIDVKGGDEPMAVLTKPVKQLPGGLIPKNYTGNVFDGAGKATGRVFFSGNRDKRPNSHSWVIVNGIAYDPVLGTKGPAVDDAIGGRFIFDDGDAVATEVGGTRVLTRDPKLKPSGAHNITAGWRLS